MATGNLYYYDSNVDWEHMWLKRLHAKTETAKSPHDSWYVKEGIKIDADIYLHDPSQLLLKFVPPKWRRLLDEDCGKKCQKWKHCKFVDLQDFCKVEFLFCKFSWNMSLDRPLPTNWRYSSYGYIT